ncbi:MAG TPA: hypothetical protein VEI45_04835, partial [Mycobacterium sp.]|nr:hypothetical protein [Mycobacterium sp.]
DQLGQACWAAVASSSYRRGVVQRRQAARPRDGLVGRLSHGVRRRDVCGRELNEPFGARVTPLERRSTIRLKRDDLLIFEDLAATLTEAPPMYKKLHEHVESFYNIH